MVPRKKPLNMDVFSDNQLLLIPHETEKGIVRQRVTDGYINATAICKACNKVITDYTRLINTTKFIEELVSKLGIPSSELIQVIKGGIPDMQGTWVHPQVAINLAQWASPKFAVLVSEWVLEWVSGGFREKHHKLTYHLERYMINFFKIPPTHFAVFNEIIINLIAPLQHKGYILPDKLIPDISQGKIFAGWVRKEKGLEPNDFPTYTHTYPDGRKAPNVKLYPNELLADFRKHLHEVWIKEKSKKYFMDRDIKAIPYLEKVILEIPDFRKEGF